MNGSLKIVALEPDQNRATEITQALCNKGCDGDSGRTDVIMLQDTTTLSQVIAKTNPDIVLIGLARPDQHMLEELCLASGAKTRPVAMFVERSDESLSKAAIIAGLSAYVVGDLSKARIRPVLETAIARFELMSQITSERDAAKRALQERKTIDRAKGLLMSARNLSEDKAYNLLRSTAMEQNRKLADVAAALVTSAELLK